MRSEEGGVTVDCDDPDVILACLDEESDACPAACREDSDNGDEEDNKGDEKDEVVKSGDLAVSATTNNGGAILANGTSDMDTLTFKTSEEVEITRVVLEKYGYVKTADIADVRLEDENGTRISTEGTHAPDSKGQVKLSIKKDYRTVDGSFDATVVVRTNIAAVAGAQTLGFKVVDVTSTAENVDLDNYSPYTYQVVDYDGANVTITKKSANKKYNWEAGESYEVAKFKLRAPDDSGIEVKSFVLTDQNNQVEYDEFLKDVTVTVAGEEVKSTWSVKDQEITIGLKDAKLEAKENAEFVVSVEFEDDFDNFGKVTNLMIVNATDVIANESKTNSRATIVNGVNVPYATVATDWYSCTFNGGKIQLDSKNLGNIDASENSTDIVIAEGEITTSQAIKSSANGVTITVDNTNVTATGTPATKNKKLVKAIRIVVAGDEYEGTHATAGVNDVWSFPSIEIDKTSKIKVLVDTVEQGGTKGDYVNFTIKGLNKYGKDGATMGFYYDDVKGNVPADMAGSLTISQLTLTPSKATLTNTISSDEVEFKAGKTTKQTILKGTYTAKKTDVYLNEFSLKGAATTDWNAADSMTVYLYVGGDLVADADLDNSKVSTWIATDTFKNVLVEAGESVDVELVAEVEATQASTLSAVKFELTLVGEDENGNPNSGEASKQTSKISIVSKGTPEVTDERASNIVLLRGSEGAIAEFIVKPSGSSNIDLELVQFDKPAGVACKDLKLTVGSVDENFIDDGASHCKVSGFAENIEKDGETLRIEFENEPSFSTSLIKAEVKHLVLNETSISKEFSKAYADAVLTFNQKNNTDKTEFTIADIEKYNSTAEVYDLHFYDENDNEIQTNGMLPSKALSVNDKFTAYNLKKSVPVKKIRYTVKRGSDIQIVEITYDPYKDSFKTNDGDLQTYAYGDADTNDTNIVTATVVAPTSLPAVVASWLDVTSLDKVQQNIVVDNANKKITGTLKKLTSASAQNAGASVTNGYVLYIKVNNAVAGTSKVRVNGTPVAFDSDKDVSLTITSTADTVKLDMDGNGTADATYDLSGLTLEA